MCVNSLFIHKVTLTGVRKSYKARSKPCIWYMNDVIIECSGAAVDAVLRCPVALCLLSRVKPGGED